MSTLFHRYPQPIKVMVAAPASKLDPATPQQDLILPTPTHPLALNPLRARLGIGQKGKRQYAEDERLCYGKIPSLSPAPR